MSNVYRLCTNSDYIAKLVLVIKIQTNVPICIQILILLKFSNSTPIVLI